MYSISVIIPVRNKSLYLEKLLQKLSENLPTKFKTEIIVVDDCSEENVQSIATQHYAQYHRLEEQKGPAFARNTGAQKASGNILLFLDSDIIYQKGVLEIVHEQFREDPDLAAISFLNQNYCPEDGVLRNYSASYEHYFFQRLKDSLPGNLINGFTSRNGAVKKDVFVALNGFNIQYKTNAMEDYDFSHRIGARFKTIAVDTPYFYHYSPDSFFVILRNWFVRTALFVPYYLKNRPKLDKSQISTSEFLLRIFETCMIIIFTLSFVYPEYALYTLTVSLIGFIIIGWGLRNYLRTLKKWSASYRFCMYGYVLHILTSVAITAGGFWGLVSTTVDGSIFKPRRLHSR